MSDQDDYIAKAMKDGNYPIAYFPPGSAIIHWIERPTFNYYAELMAEEEKKPVEERYHPSKFRTSQLGLEQQLVPQVIETEESHIARCMTDEIPSMRLPDRNQRRSLNDPTNTPPTVVYHWTPDSDNDGCVKLVPVVSFWKPVDLQAKLAEVMANKRLSLDDPTTNTINEPKPVEYTPLILHNPPTEEEWEEKSKQVMEEFGIDKQ
jgi:hypothetical protein